MTLLPKVLAWCTGQWIKLFLDSLLVTFLLLLCLALCLSLSLFLPLCACFCICHCVFAVLTSWFSPGDRPPPAACPSDRFQASLSACPSAAGSQSTGLQVIVYCLVFSVQDFVFSHVRFKQIIWVNENHLLPAVVAWSPFRFLYFPM